MQWLPCKYPHQLLYIIYRWLLVLYFFIWLIIAGKEAGNPRYFIFLTNWAHISYNLYLLISALSTTAKVVNVHCLTKHKQSNRNGVNTTKCCSTPINQLTWYQMIHWLFYTIGNESAIFVCFLYWCFIYRGGNITGVNANTHLVNGLLAFVDLWISGTPVNFLHCVYLMIFGAIYSTFSGIYFVLTGEVIYYVLDYRENAGGAVGLYLALIFLLLPAIHSLIFAIYLCKQWALNRRCFVYQRRPSERDLKVAAVSLEMSSILNSESDQSE